VWGKASVRKKGKCVRKKTTRRCSCKARIKLRKVYAKDGSLCCVVIDFVNHNHNHNFLPSPSRTKNFHCNWELDPAYLEYIGSMQASRVPEHCLMDHMAELHDGVENVMLTREDLANMWVPPPHPYSYFCAILECSSCWNVVHLWFQKGLYVCRRRFICCFKIFFGTCMILQTKFLCMLFFCYG
jgi:hypothetical protein